MAQLLTHFVQVNAEAIVADAKTQAAARTAAAAAEGAGIERDSRRQAYEETKKEKERVRAALNDVLDDVSHLPS